MLMYAVCCNEKCEGNHVRLTALAALLDPCHALITTGAASSVHCSAGKHGTFL
jgi:hypothetical protein